MKAAVITGFGTPSVFQTTNVSRPVPKAHELLVRIEAAGINRLDHYIREGGVNPDLTFPHILGSDAVGVVEDAGNDVTGFSVGERVIPMPGYPTNPTDDGADVLAVSPSYAIRGLAENGTYAEYMTVPARWTLKAPEGISAVDLATLPMALVTAVRAVKVVGGVKKNDTVLVQAGASGTGSFMVQVAKALGAKVAATVRSEEKRAFVTGLGADLVVNMKEDTLNTVREWSGGGVDVVIDNLGGESLARSVEMSRPLGLTVLMGNVLGLESVLPVRSVFFPQRRIAGTLMGGVDDLEWGLGQVQTGTVKPTLDRTYSLDEAEAAHIRLAAGDAVGNIVFEVS
ncbi:zinc-binding alcohol dehydrogenase family protein [Sulfitobacter sp. S190]|uniref:quinone oxidoreductase family protein n=1 Tax=Sulfitobacter sp. S190 TaxID=2867022 RepID=UPI0021A92EA1|nr:zinc-binding alcohol dehydrogenase family protein [Sulfitobacter sp. S190]UWR24588.1 zinc-binding alcohol dehydrogenase family protein [Sulfitobacter sp. S190]